MNSKLICFIISCNGSTTNFFFSISKSSKVGGGGCHEHPMNDSFSLKWNPWEMLPITWFISYLQFSADNIFVYIFTRVINFSVSVQIITLRDSIWSRSSGLWERRRKTPSSWSAVWTMLSAACWETLGEGGGRAVCTVVKPWMHYQNGRWHLARWLQLTFPVQGYCGELGRSATFT